jgi:hypothetical protein
MTTRHRIATGTIVALVLATSAPPALALPTEITASGTEVPASPSVSNQVTQPPTAPTIVRVSAPTGGFDFGDAGIGAAGGFAISMIAVGGALVASQRRSRRSESTTALTT